MTVTDLDDALYLLSLGGSDPVTPPVDPDTEPAQLPRALFPFLQSLNFSLYVSPEFYHALALPDPLPEDWTPAGDPDFDLPANCGPDVFLFTIHDAHKWRRFWADLARLARLARVAVWLDNEIQTWSGMDEAGTLRPVLDAAERLPVAKVAVHLPQIPEDEVDREKHFAGGDGEPQLPVDLRRADRRPTDVIEDEDGSEFVVCREFLRRSGCLRILEVGGGESP